VFSLHDRFAIEVSSPVAFERLYNGLVASARGLIAWLDRESLAQYAGLFLAACLLLGGLAWGSFDAPLRGPLPLTPVDLPALIGFLVLAIGVVGATLLHQQRFLAVILLSLAGVIVALVFLRFAAPDLALTQLSVELATIMLFLLALRFLPAPSESDTRPDNALSHLALAVAAGIATAVLAFAILSRPFETISAFHIAQAKPGGGGTNVVNVILVDFRGFDTLGEIAVLAVAALGASALLAGLVLRPRVPNALTEADRFPIMLRMMMQPMLPLALAMAAYIFLRGHNLPGGGFIAGLVAAVAIVLQYLAAGIDHAQARVRVNFARLLGAGLLIATLTGIASWLFGAPFLTSAFTYITLPPLETFELASALVFDLGIFLVVVSTIVLILTELGMLSRREDGSNSDPAQRPKMAAAPALVQEG
jgi:multicomponent K+:H+ antiporter subunit A